MSESAFNGTVLEGRKERYTVLKQEDLESYCWQHQFDELDNILYDIQEGRKENGKKPFNNYIVINTDEPYINDIVQILKDNGHWEENNG